MVINSTVCHTTFEIIISPCCLFVVFFSFILSLYCSAAAPAAFCAIFCKNYTNIFCVFPHMPVQLKCKICFLVDPFFVNAINYCAYYIGNESIGATFCTFQCHTIAKRDRTAKGTIKTVCVCMCLCVIWATAVQKLNVALNSGIIWYRQHNCIVFYPNTLIYTFGNFSESMNIVKSCTKQQQQ